MKFSFFDGADNGEYTGVGFVEIYKLFAIQDEVFFRIEPLDSLAWQRGPRYHSFSNATEVSENLSDVTIISQILPHNTTVFNHGQVACCLVHSANLTYKTKSWPHLW